MKALKTKLVILLFSLLGITNTAQAFLFPTSNGTIYDTFLSIEWMMDANLFKTLCDANDPLATGFTPIDTADANTICTNNNGAMTWNDAEAWIARLNANNYLGHNDWRQPKTLQPDTSCESLTPARNGAPEQWSGYNCRGSEMPHLFGGLIPLFSGGLSNWNHAGTGTTFGPDGERGTIGNGCAAYMVSNCLTNTESFENLQASAYWSGTEQAGYPGFVWMFSFYYGGQENGFEKNDLNVPLYVLPVRDEPLIPRTKKPSNFIDSLIQ